MSGNVRVGATGTVEVAVVGCKECLVGLFVKILRNNALLPFWHGPKVGESSAGAETGDSRLIRNICDMKKSVIDALLFGKSQLTLSATDSRYIGTASWEAWSEASGVIRAGTSVFEVGNTIIARREQ